MVDEILSAVNQEVQHARLAAERASANGKVTTS